jgi:hypothetical protein
LWTYTLPKSNRPARRRCRANPTIRPRLEALEDRAVPTVAFTPADGTTLAPASSPSGSLSSPTVNIIFHGTSWTNADEQTVIHSVQSILNGPYLSGLNQPGYGSDGKATFGTVTQNNAPLSLDTAFQGGFYPSQKVLDSFVNPPLPSGSTKTIYVVVNDPQDSQGTVGVNDPSLNNGSELIYVGTSSFNGSLNKDSFTTLFSHELAESMVTNVQVTDPAGFAIGGNQIADNEPEAFDRSYSYRLAGTYTDANGNVVQTSNLVQAYWSQKDGAFIVPDGNSQTFTLSLTSPRTNTSSDQYELDVVGDQMAGQPNDQITLDRTTNPTQPNGVRVTLNGESVQFDAGRISSVYVNTGNGQNRVTVNALPAGVSASIDSWGASKDTVTIGGNGSLQGIAGPITVSNSSGQTSLIVNDQLDSARSIAISDSAVSFDGKPVVTYQAGYTDSNGNLLGVTNLIVGAPQLSNGTGNQILVSSVPGLAAVTVVDNPSDIVQVFQTSPNLTFLDWELFLALGGFGG